MAPPLPDLGTVNDMPVRRHPAYYLGMLDVLEVPGRLFRDVSRAAAYKRCARRQGGKFREGHPNRHKLCSLFVSRRLARCGFRPCRHVPMT